MLKELSSRGLKSKSGVVYFITNPAWIGMIKVGMTSDLDTRLRAYQTYDPNRAYVAKHYEFVLDRRQTERSVLDIFKVDVSEVGEWIPHRNSVKVIEFVRNAVDYHLPYATQWFKRPDGDLERELLGRKILYKPGARHFWYGKESVIGDPDRYAYKMCIRHHLAESR